jgi:RHS repeat-associated protein
MYFYHPDHLGSSTFLTDANGNAYQFFLNLPFGETMAEQRGSQYYQTPYKFNGKELDEETGLYYYGARYYDPKASIWLSTDPKAEKYPHVNPYAYTFQNPINYLDPDGKDPIDVWKGFMAAMIDYSTLGFTNFRSWTHVSPENIKDFNTGLKLADHFVIAEAMAEITGGGGAAAGGIATMEVGVATLIVPGLGEVSFVVCEGSGVILTTVGTIVASHGAVLLKMAKENISEGNYQEEEQTPEDLTERKGGGKNGQHANQKAKQSAEQKYNELKSEYDALKSKPNKSPADKKLLKKLEGQVKQQQMKKDFSGENHSRNAKGSR